MDARFTPDGRPCPALPLTGDEPVEDLVDCFPEAVTWLRRNNVLCVRCGEAFWGPLSDLLRDRRSRVADPQAMLAELNDHLLEDS